MLEATGRHPLWSRTRGAWVRTAELREGEQLATRGGSVRVLTVRAQPGVHRVYNLEVPGAHCYYAGESAVLAHNDCASGTHTSSGGGLPELFEVGDASDLRKATANSDLKGTGATQVNHFPGSAAAGSLNSTQNAVNNFGTEVGIRVPTGSSGILVVDAVGFFPR